MGEYQINGGKLFVGDRPIGDIKSGEFEFLPPEEWTIGAKEWTATLESFPEFSVEQFNSRLETTHTMEFVMPRKWWQWIIPLRTVYSGSSKYNGGEKVEEGDESFFNSTFYVDNLEKRYEFAWKK